MHLMKALLFTLFVLLHLDAFSSIQLHKIESLILDEQFTQAKKLLSKEKPVAYVKALRRICTKKATYNDFEMFIQNIEIYGKSEYQKLDGFLNQNVKAPTSDKLNLDYVKIRWLQVSNSRNELSLEISNQENELLKSYVNQFISEKNMDYQKAKILINSHEIVVNFIQGDIKKGMHQSLKDQRSAALYKDTFLLLMTKFYYSNFLIQTNQLEEYIKITEESIALETGKEKKTEFYASNIGNLIDALIYKGDFDQLHIEQLLLSLYEKEKTRYFSFSLYAKYLGAIPKNSPGQERVYKLFGVDDLEQFCDLIYRKSEGKINMLELYHVVNECSTALRNNGYFEKALAFKDNCIQLNMQIYTKELSQSLADFQTKEADQEKKVEIDRANQRTKYFLSTTIISSFFLIFLIVLLIKFRAKSNALEIRNRERELLLREIHHRVKNNFQLMIGFVRLQEKFSTQLKIEDFIQAIEMKMNSMSLVHDLLNNENDFEKVDIKVYLQELGESIINSLTQYNLDIEFHVSGDKAEAKIDQVIPIGLVANEVLTNAMKHARNENLELKIELKNNQDSIIISIADNGCGLADDFNFEESNTLGMKVILLLMKQIDATVTWKNENGLIWTFNIPKK